ncbi:MAG: hypothetical protein L3J10_04260 [Sulfurimonas sp.]|nr:hypothetical protein [Sulfurimonas sp.]
MANLNKMNKENKNSTVFTPERLSKTIFNIINNTYNFKTIFDPCIGENGGMTKFFFENEYKVIGADIDKKGEEHCHLFFNQDIKQSNIPENVKPDLIVMNPPFNGNGRGDNLLYPHLFLKEMFDRFGEEIPVVMITGDNFLNNNSMHSKRLKYISDGKFKITSIMTLPLDTFEDVKFNTQVLFFNMPKLQPYYIYDVSKTLTTTLTKPLHTMGLNLQKKEKQIDLKKDYNLLTKISPFVKKTLDKINIILNVNNILNNDYKLLKNIVGEIQYIDIPKNSTARKSFTDALNQVLKDKDRLSHNIDTVVHYFNKLKNGETIEKVVENKSSLNIFKKRAYIVKFFKNILLNLSDKNIKMVCQTIITRVQNSNDFTPIIYTEIKRGFLTEEEVIDFANKLVKDYKQVSSHVLFSLAGNKNELKKVIDKTINEHINMNIVEKVVIPFIGTASEYMNILPKIEGKNIPVIFSAYEKTPYHLFVDIKDNRESLIKEIKLIEIEQVEDTKNSTNRDKYRKFNKLKLKELNTLESQRKWGVRTSALFLFTSAKGFGGNIEWVNNETKISFPLDMDKSIRSISAKVEYFGHLMDKCDITIENESFEVVIEKYDSFTTLFLLDPQYLKENSHKLESTRTTYGNFKFPHKLCIDKTIKLQGQFLYHNYKNYKLTELMTQDHMECIEYTKFKKNAKAHDGKYESCTEVIYHSKIENFSTISINDTTYQPQKMVS